MIAMGSRQLVAPNSLDKPPEEAPPTSVGGKMRTCGSADVATGKMRMQTRINIRILPTHAPCLTVKFEPLIFHGIIC